MKINKILLRIAHFFNLYKNTHHIDDLIVDIVLDYDPTDVLIRRKSLHDKKLVDEVKSQIFKRFSIDECLRKRCLTVRQVWVTFSFYEKINGENKIHNIHIMEKLYYDDDVLFYPCIDDKSRKRYIKLKDLGL